MDNQHWNETPENFHISPARLEDVPIILELIRDLATYEGATHEVTATEEQRLNLRCCCAKEECLAQHHS